jgi:Golgi phosphoprotein 3 (GPP34)
MDLPQTLHSRLYLLAYDRKRHRFDVDHPRLFGFALRAAMLTDLYLTGHLEDKGGRPVAIDSVARPDDPVLRAAFDQIGVTGRKDWAQLIATNDRDAPHAVRGQLKATGWLRAHQRQVLGIIPITRLGPYDEDTVSSVADQATEALRRAIDGLPADPRPLATGLLAVLAQMPTVLSFKESSQHQQELREMIFAAIAPIVGLHQAIEKYHEDVRANMAMGGGGG